MRIASFNVNSIKIRLPRVLEWLDATRPDVVCLQELKCEDGKFPALEIEERGYNVAVHGQKTYNGVALLSRHPIEDVTRGLSGDDGDEQARYVEALVMPDGAPPMRVASLYLPNGNPAPGPKYDYKLAWMRRLQARAAELLALEEAAVFAGDYNVIPQTDDVHDPQAWKDDALFRPETRTAYRTLLNLGLTEAWRTLNPDAIAYTFWDYQRGAWAKDHGIRIDHLLLTPQAADRLRTAGIDRSERAKEKPSDHVPVWIEID